MVGHRRKIVYIHLAHNVEVDMPKMYVYSRLIKFVFINVFDHFGNTFVMNS